MFASLHTNTEWQQVFLSMTYSGHASGEFLSLKLIMYHSKNILTYHILILCMNSSMLYTTNVLFMWCELSL